MTAGLHQGIEGECSRLHARIADDRAGGVFLRLQLTDQRRRGGGAITGVQVGQFRPAAFAGEQECGLGFLPRDHLCRAEEIQLNRRVVRVEVRNAGSPRMVIDRAVDGLRCFAHRLEWRASRRADVGIEPIANRAQSMTPRQSRCSTRARCSTAAVTSAICASELAEIMKAMWTRSVSLRVARFCTVRP